MVKAIQDTYPDSLSHCYGCGRLNEQGYHIKSAWEGEQCICDFQPRPYHTAIPGYVYGGLLASLIDCHSTGTAAAAVFRQGGEVPGAVHRFLTASLHVEYLRPTPIDAILQVRATVTEIKGRKVTVDSKLYARGAVCVTGRVIAVEVPESRLIELIEKRLPGS